MRYSLNWKGVISSLSFFPLNNLSIEDSPLTYNSVASLISFVFLQIIEDHQRLLIGRLIQLMIFDIIKRNWEVTGRCITHSCKTQMISSKISMLPNTRLESRDNMNHLDWHILRSAKRISLDYDMLASFHWLSLEYDMLACFHWLSIFFVMSNIRNYRKPFIIRKEIK